MPAWDRFDAPGVEPLLLAATGSALCSVWFGGDSEALRVHLLRRFPSDVFTREPGHSLLREAARQLDLYFRGALRDFDIPLEAGGTPFQQSVWSALREIPYGDTRSYRDIAAAIGNPKGVRAVGAANGSNPIPIVVPCHRVIASDGSLCGFGGGLDWKRRLLALEKETRWRYAPAT